MNPAEAIAVAAATYAAPHFTRVDAHWVPDSLDPDDWERRSLAEILQIMYYYVLINPSNIIYSPEFLQAFAEMTDLDETLHSADFERMIQNSEYFTEFDAMRTTLFRIQLRIVLRKKIKIEVECPDNPNIKRIIQLYNQKLEALLRLLEQQNKMDNEEKYVDVQLKKGATRTAAVSFGNSNTYRFGASVDETLQYLHFSIQLSKLHLGALDSRSRELQDYIAESQKLITIWNNDPAWSTTNRNQ